MAKRILVVKTGEALPSVKAEYGDFEDWIANGLGLPVDSLDVCSVFLGAKLPAVDTVSGVVITGSPLMVTQRFDWSEAAASWLADVVVEDAAPVLGLCYGHQLLAHAHLRPHRTHPASSSWRRPSRSRTPTPAVRITTSSPSVS